MVTRKRKTWLGWCLAITAVALLPKHVFAASQPQDGSKWYVEQAQLYSDMGSWDAALADYEAAYAITRDPALLVKMGDVCRRKGDLKRAIDCYRNYLEKVPNAPDRPVIERRIRELEEQVKQPPPAPGAPATGTPSEATPEPIQPSVAPAAPPAGSSVAAGPRVPTADDVRPTPVAAQPLEQVPAPPLPPPGAPAGEQGLTPPVAQSPAVAPPPPPPAPAQVAIQPHSEVSAEAESQSTPGTRILGVVLMAGGGTLLGLGGYFSWRTKSIESSVNDSHSFDSDKYNDGQTAETAQWVCYGIGVGAAITGLVLYLTARSRPSRLSFVPQLGPGTAGLGAQGVF